MNRTVALSSSWLRVCVVVLLLVLLLPLVGCSSPRVDAKSEAMGDAAAVALLPTQSGSPAVLPPLTLTPSPSWTATATATATASVTPTATPSVTPTIPSATPTATETPLLAANLTATARPTAWPTPDGPLTPEERALLFDELWTVVNERYIDPAFNGVNWAAEREYRRPRALGAPDDAIYYQELKAMVSLLNDGHSRFMTPDEAIQHFALARNEVTYGGFGLYTMPLPDGALVLQVIPGSPAERAGILSCDRVTALNGGGYWGDGGEVGTSATLSMQRPGGNAYTITLTREEINQVLEVPGELLPGRARRIGYVRLDTLWVFEIPERLRVRLAELEADGPLDGLIIDLRSNAGGWRPVLQGILGIFVEGHLGEFYGRLDSDPLVAPRDEEPAPSHPDLPLVVLVGPRTESYAE
ncbi:MAG: S41 family peptidase, partial [Ardenticatenaceae bacterium]